MMYAILIIVGIVVVIFVGLLIFMPRRASSDGMLESISSTVSGVSNIPALTPAPGPEMTFTPSAEFQSTYHAQAYQARGNALPQTPIPTYNDRSGYVAHTPTSLRFQQEPVPRLSGNTRPTGYPFYELDKEMAYDHGMQAVYDERLQATFLVISNVVMKTPADVDLAFQVCTRKIQTVLRPRGMQRAPLLVDIAGLVIGGEATTSWGQSLKSCWDQICTVVEKDRYMAAHYNSKASLPSQEQIQEKVRRIQIMTSAALNDFQSNMFDSREEAIAFLGRLKELQHS